MTDILETLQTQIQPVSYTDSLDLAISQINADSNPLKIRGINDPAYLLLGTYVFLAQLTLEQFIVGTSQLALNLVQMTGTDELQPSSAKGTVTLTLASQAVLTDTTLSSPSGVRYRQVNPPTLCLADTPTDIQYEAEVVGTVGNSTFTGDLIAEKWYISVPATSASTSTGFLGGRDADTPEQLIQRGLAALSSRQTPLSAKDWDTFVRQSLLVADNNTDAIVRTTTSWETTLLPADEGSCPNMVTRPLLTLYVARNPTTPATAADLEYLETELDALRILHTRLELLSLPRVDISAKVVVSLNTTPKEPLLLLDSVVAVFNKYLRSLPDFVQHRYLLSEISRISGIDIVEDVWLGNDAQPLQPEPLGATTLKPDNLKLGLNLGVLSDLTLELLAPNYQQVLFFNLD